MKTRTKAGKPRVKRQAPLGEPLGLAQATGLPKLKIDWRALYANFEREHGEAQEVGGKLVFADGWSHAIDYRGPVYGPPADPLELARLLRSFWLLRKREARQALRGALEESKKLLGLLDSRPDLLQQADVAYLDEMVTPLYTRALTPDDGQDGPRRPRRQSLTRSGLERQYLAELNRLRSVIQECDDHLSELRDP